jgi:hypothetical protein
MFFPFPQPKLPQARSFMPLGRPALDCFANCGVLDHLLGSIFLDHDTVLSLPNGESWVPLKGPNGNVIGEIQMQVEESEYGAPETTVCPFPSPLPFGALAVRDHSSVLPSTCMEFWAITLRLLLLNNHTMASSKSFQAHLNTLLGC